MTNLLLTRLLWSAALIALGLALYWLINRAILLRARSQKHFLAQPGIPAILYFTTPDCAACKTVQRPALQRLKDHLGDRLTLIEINAQEQPDLASRWGVLSVPTTFILDASGQPRHVNHGVTRAEKLLEQVTAIAQL